MRFRVLSSVLAHRLRTVAARLALAFVRHETGDGGDAVVGLQPLQANTLRGPANDADLPDVDPIHLPLLGDHHHLILLLYLQGAHHGAVLLGDADVDDALAATALEAVLLQLRALAVPPFVHREHRGPGPDDLRRHHLVARLQVNADDAAAAAADGPDLLLSEADGHALLGGQEDLVLSSGEAHGDQLVRLVQRERDDPSRARVAVCLELGLLHHAATGRHEQVPTDLELSDGNHGRDHLPRLHLEEVDQRLTLGG